MAIRTERELKDMQYQIRKGKVITNNGTIVLDVEHAWIADIVLSWVLDGMDEDLLVKRLSPVEKG